MSTLQTTAVFNFEELMYNFVDICPDFTAPLMEKRPFYCVEFYRKILYEIGPESRAVKQTIKKDKAWWLKFVHKVDNIVQITTATICTFKNSEPPKTGNQLINSNITMPVC